MPRNGSGTFTLPQPPFVPNTTIASASVNSDFSDIATALTQSIAVDGQTTITGQLKFPSGTSAAPSHTFATDLTTGMYYPGTKQVGFSAGGVAAVSYDLNNTGTGQNGNIIKYMNTGVAAYPCPVGMLVDFAGGTAPAGWLLCYGQVIAQASYPELFQIISSTYNTGGEGAGNFRLPDCRGRTTFGQDNMGGSTAGRITVAGGNFDGTVLGGNGGVQNQTLARSALPNVALTYSGTTSSNSTGISAALSPNTQLVTSGTGSGPAAGNSIQFTGTSITITDPTHSHSYSGSTSSINGGVGQTTVPAINPAIIFNKIIFAGRP